MKNLVLLLIGVMLLFSCWLVINAYSKQPVITAKVQGNVKGETGCTQNAIVRTHYSFNDPSQLCGYLLECDNGKYISPAGMKKSFPFADGQRIRVGYKIIEEIGFILDCQPPFSGPFYAAKINCIQELKTGQ